MSYMTGKDMLLLPNGATYHLGVKAGELAPRIIVVGSRTRAAEMAKLLDCIEHQVESSRLMYTFTGPYHGVPCSIVAIGMGAPMMDFFVREASYVCPGTIACIRVGTCGLFNPSLLPGTVVAAGKGCCLTYINNAAFTKGLIDGTPYEPSDLYLTTKPVLPDAELHRAVMKELSQYDMKVVDGLNNASETFYAAQGRQDAHFYNGENNHILETFAKYGVDSCEMESFTLLQLAHQRTVAPLKATAIHIGLLNRVNPAMTTNISAVELHKLETECAKACFEALIATEI